MKWFKTPLVVEIPAATHLPAVDATEVLTSLKDQLGFRYILHQLRNATAYVEAKLLGTRHTDLTAVAYLQGERAGLRFVENYIRRMTETKPDAMPRSAARNEQQVFEQVRSQLEEVR